MKLKSLYSDFMKSILANSPKTLLEKSYAKLTAWGNNLIERNRDIKKGTFCKKLPFSGYLEFVGQEFADQAFGLPKKGFEETIQQFLNHRFDLLGSGWVRVHHGMKCSGIEGVVYDMGAPIIIDWQGRWLEGRVNQSNLAEAVGAWKLIDPNYIPIDWHIDIKSGFRWSENTWYKDIQFGHKIGVDIKLPWELARMQHLVQLALGYYSLAERSPKRAIEELEFKNQILDFIATNPPRFGVNWACTMDVAIRAANWLVAYEVFKLGGAQFDNAFQYIITKSIYEHGQHIWNNLEWYDGKRGNHYLANIAGLAFIAVFLPSCDETDAWLAFAVQELITEVKYQFYPDGSNFHCSTAYHRLSGEMVYFATALILGMPEERMDNLKQYDSGAVKTKRGRPMLNPSPLPFFRLPGGSDSRWQRSPFPRWYFERMERMSEFIIDITKPDGRILQIGDNDSGRFLKFGAKYKIMTVRDVRAIFANLDAYRELNDKDKYVMEDQLNCSHLVAIGSCFFRREDFVEWLITKKHFHNDLDCFFIRHLLGSTILGSQRMQRRKDENSSFFSMGAKQSVKKFLLSEVLSKPENHIQMTEFVAPRNEKDLFQNLRKCSYPDFGLYLYFSSRLYLAIRCRTRRAASFGHMHEDQLAMELLIDGKELILDPGTYLYTPLPKQREEYRSKQAHFVPCISNQGKRTFQEIYPVSRIPKQAALLAFLDNCFLGKIVDNCTVARMIRIYDNKVHVFDFSPKNNAFLGKELLKLGYSEAYGWRKKENCPEFVTRPLSLKSFENNSL